MNNKIKNAVATVVSSIIGGILYRMGGAAGYNTKFRDFGIPSIEVGLFLIWSWGQYDLTFLSLILTFGLVFAAQTTYWKKKGADARWFNWLFTGLGYSICWIPTVIIQNIFAHAPVGPHAHWIGFGIRSVICTGLTILIGTKIGNDVWSENLRGIVEVATVPILFIG